jgi:3-hydroxyisobutyrate dehydrogenase-like beta-hydroxyacid dehydrogenase
MIGGEDAAVQQVEPAMKAMSSPGRLFRCGGLGAASTIKM